MSIAEIRILRWISRNIQKDRIQNEENPLKIKVTLIDENMRERERERNDFVMFIREQLMHH